MRVMINSLIALFIVFFMFLVVGASAISVNAAMDGVPKTQITSISDGDVVNSTTVTIGFRILDSKPSMILYSLRDLTTNRLIYNRVSISASSRSKKISDLTPGHEYRFAVAAVSSNGTEKWDEVEFSVLGYSKVNFTSIDDYETIASGEKVKIEFSYSGMKPKKYLYSLRDLTTNELIYNRKMLSSSSRSITFKLLQSGHTFRFALASVASDGTEKWNEVVFSIAESKMRLAITNPTSNLNYESNKKVTATFEVYDGSPSKIIYSLRNLSTGELIKERKSISKASRSLTFSSLPDGRYRLAIAAVGKDKTEKWDEVEFTVCANNGYDVQKNETSKSNVPVSNYQGIDFIWPVADCARVTTVYNCNGTRCHSNGTNPDYDADKQGNLSYKYHHALDINDGKSHDILAAASGKVVVAGFPGAGTGFGGYGYVVVIDHGSGIYTQYSHLASISVTVGSKVQAGDIIGKMGGTANDPNKQSYAVHLDFQVLKDAHIYEKNGTSYMDYVGEYIDPFMVLPLDGVYCSLSCDQEMLDKAKLIRGYH